MPVPYLRRLTSAARTERSNRHLARILAFVAGAVNAGGYLAVRHYTSHMTGIISSVADNIAIGSFALAAFGLASAISFFSGAALTTGLVRWARSRTLSSLYALPLLFEAALLVVFGITGHEFNGNSAIGTVMLLCFTMGLQNAIITKITGNVIRTTHLTGMVTDSGIAFGRIVFRFANHTHESIAPELDTLSLLGSLIFLFFAGGVTGALGFRHIGFLFTLPLAAVLLVLAIVPIVDDMRAITKSCSVS
jgi:uncharacterized membrane protein YoaK (UPF0700 family)